MRKWPAQVAIVLLVGGLIYLDRFATSYLGQRHQMIIGWSCLGALVVMYLFRKSRSMPPRRSWTTAISNRQEISSVAPSTSPEAPGFLGSRTWRTIT